MNLVVVIVSVTIIRLSYLSKLGVLLRRPNRSINYRTLGGLFGVITFAMILIIGSSAFPIMALSKSSSNSNKSAVTIVYSYTDEELRKVIAKDVGTAQDNRIYPFSYSADPTEYSIYMTTIHKMINSFETIPINLTYSNNV